MAVLLMAARLIERIVGHFAARLDHESAVTMSVRILVIEDELKVAEALKRASSANAMRCRWHEAVSAATFCFTLSRSIW